MTTQTNKKSSHSYTHIITQKISVSQKKKPGTRKWQQQDKIIQFNFFIIKPSRCIISQIYFGMNLYMFRAVRLSIIRSLFTVHSAVVYVIQVCRQLSSRTRMERITVLVMLESCLQTCMTYTTAECTVNKLLMMDRRTARNM